MDAPDKKPMTVQEAGRLGGNKLKMERGADYYRAIGKLGGAAVKAKYPDHFKRIGTQGGEAVKAKLGSEHYERIGKLGGAKVREAMAAMKAKEKKL